MHVPINVKSPNNISEWQMGFNSAFKGLNKLNTELNGGIFRLNLNIFGVHKVLENYSGKAAIISLLKKDHSAWSCVADYVIQWGD